MNTQCDEQQLQTIPLDGACTIQAWASRCSVRAIHVLGKTLSERRTGTGQRHR